jgi:NAD dependent epimerase/dehydratase
MKRIRTSDRVLVTGADGFIGSHLTEELVRQGYKVRALVQYNSFNSWGWLDDTAKEIKSEIEVISGDIRDPQGTRNVVKGCSSVMHLAALIGIPFSYNSPDLYVDTNVKGTLNLLQAAREFDVEKFINTSTSEVYGSAEFVPITESHPTKGQSPYAASKIAADQLVYSFYNSFELPTITIRPFNTYGPRQSARAIIPTIITQIASGSQTIELGELSMTRDFSFVSDTAQGFISALQFCETFGETINLGSNFEISMQDTACLIANIINKKVEFTSSKERIRPRKSEVTRLWADNSKARELLKWSPEYAGLEGFNKGLETTINWFTDPSNLSRYKAGIYNV